MSSSSATSRSPPARWTVTGLVHQPCRTAAPATATALVPEESVSPAPRSQTRDPHVVRPVDANQLDVRAKGEALVVLDQRAQAEELVALRLAADDCMRVADRDRDELDGLVADVDRLRLPHLDRADVHLDLLAVAHRGDDLARPDGNPRPRRSRCGGRASAQRSAFRCRRARRSSRPGSRSRPRRGRRSQPSPRRCRPSRRRSGSRTASGHARASAGRQAQPARPAGNRCRARATWRSSSAISPEGRSAFRLTRPGMRRIHLRW